MGRHPAIFDREPSAALLHRSIGPWVLGEDYSVCDAYLYTFARWLELDRVDTSRLPRVLAHRRLMETRPGVQSVLKAEGIAPMGDLA